MMHLEDRDILKFADWLQSCGAEILAPTSEWEILRVKARDRTLIAYKNRRGDQSWPQPLITFWKTRNKGGHPKLGAPKKQLRGNRRARVMELAKRDGWNCWYCGTELSPPDRPADDGGTPATIEEICPRQIGGPAHIGNQTLTCRKCNQMAGNMSVVEKVALRDELRGMAREFTGKDQP